MKFQGTMHFQKAGFVLLSYQTPKIRTVTRCQKEARRQTEHLLCEGGTLFCLAFDLGLSVSCNIGGTWEELLSESPFDKVIDGSVELAGGRVLIGYFGIKLSQNFV